MCSLKGETLSRSVLIKLLGDKERRQIKSESNSLIKSLSGGLCGVIVLGDNKDQRWDQRELCREKLALLTPVLQKYKHLHQQNHYTAATVLHCYQSGPLPLVKIRRDTVF